MDVYGLTGGIGSGKSAVAALLEEYGVPVVSADELSRIVVAKGSAGLEDVVKLFGPEVLDEHGELDRRKMASIVFQEPAKRRQLEAILHPRIRERFEQVLDALEKAGHEVMVYEVPLLFEKNLQGEMKAVILVTADESKRIARVCARDDVTEAEVRARIAAQMDEEQKRKRADYIIENDGTMDDLRREVEFMLARFLRVGEVRRRGTPPDGDAGEATPRLVHTQIPLGGASDQTQVAPVPPPPPRRGGTAPMPAVPSDTATQPASSFASQTPDSPPAPPPPAAPTPAVATTSPATDPAPRSDAATTPSTTPGGPPPPQPPPVPAAAPQTRPVTMPAPAVPASPAPPPQAASSVAPPRTQPMTVPTPPPPKPPAAPVPATDKRRTQPRTGPAVAPSPPRTRTQTAPAPVVPAPTTTERYPLVPERPTPTDDEDASVE